MGANAPDQELKKDCRPRIHFLGQRSFFVVWRGFAEQDIPAPKWVVNKTVRGMGRLSKASLTRSEKGVSFVGIHSDRSLAAEENARQTRGLL